MKSRHYIFAAFAAIILCACNRVELKVAEPELVVEGWIESDGFPVVTLTTTLPIDDEYHKMEDLDVIIAKWAKVTISDGENSAILTGMYHKGFFPPYIYTTSAIRGEVGKTYTLTAEYHGMTAHAVTTIPERVPIQNIEVTPTESGRYQVEMSFQDVPGEENYYKTFVRLEGENALSVYSPSYLSAISDEGHDGAYLTFPVMQSPRLPFSTFKLLMGEEDIVDVKFAQVTKEAYLYWKNFDEVMTFSRNPMVPLMINVASNIEGGHGYWFGYGVTETKIVIADYSK